MKTERVLKRLCVLAASGAQMRCSFSRRSFRSRRPSGRSERCASRVASAIFELGVKRRAETHFCKSRPDAFRATGKPLIWLGCRRTSTMRARRALVEKRAHRRVRRQATIPVGLAVDLHAAVNPRQARRGEQHVGRELAEYGRDAACRCARWWPRRTASDRSTCAGGRSRWT